MFCAHIYWPRTTRNEPGRPTRESVFMNEFLLLAVVVVYLALE